MSSQQSNQVKPLRRRDSCDRSDTQTHVQSLAFKSLFRAYPFPGIFNLLAGL